MSKEKDDSPLLYRSSSTENSTSILGCFRCCSRMTVSEARKYLEEGQFETGSMLPKIEAAISYLKKVPSGQVLITNQRSITAAIKGKTGTVITA